MARLIKDKFEEWVKECDARFNVLRSNEEELNRIFIEIYGLQDELVPEVEERNVTVRRAVVKREIKSLISYAVGCIFGRYSLDEEGLVYAGGEWDASRYKTIIPVEDNIVPVCDDIYTKGDLCGRIIDFVKTVYGDETLEENLEFIADAIGGRGTPREVLRRYLLSGFYADHLKIYHKRPIYWLFSSGRKNGFKALIYIHRYEPGLIEKMRTEYVHSAQKKYETRINMTEISLKSANAAEQAALKKQIEKIRKQQAETKEFEGKLRGLADLRMVMDMDDGVKVNYEKFSGIVEPIK